MTLQIAIVGRHPTLEPGFNAAMSLNEALGFEAHGCDVTLYLPFSDEHDPAALLEQEGLTYDTLDRFGGNFDVKPMTSAADVTGDVMVWQTYAASEHPLLIQFRGRDMLRTKNPPRMFSGVYHDDREEALGTMYQLDLVALSLQADLDIITRDHPEVAPGYAYVPRGFVVDWLDGEGRDTRATIGLDRAIRPHDSHVEPARAHIVATALRLLEDYPDLRVLTLREQIAALNSELIPHVPLRDYYDRFLNRLHIYFPIDFEESIHVAGLTHGPDGRRLFKGLYENQVVEAQIAGGLVIARRDDIPEELIMLPDVSLVDNYDDIDTLTAVAHAHLENFVERSEKTRRLAAERHNHIHMAGRWLDAIAKLG